MDYFEPHYLNITSNYILSRKDFIKKQNTKLLQFMEGKHEQQGTSLILSAISAEILSARKRCPWSVMHHVHNYAEILLS